MERYPHIGRKEQEVDAAFWQGRYQAGDTGWDQGAPSPGLVDFLAHKDYEPGSVLVPGCGRGHDARALAHAGFHVIGVDVADSAIHDAEEWARSSGLTGIRFEHADMFDLAPALYGPYDWIFEHTFFCAIDPASRDQYMALMADLLKPDGLLLGVFYNIQPETGPPFGCTRAELMERFSPQFTLVYECVPRSFPNREHKELLMLWKRSS